MEGKTAIVFGASGMTGRLLLSHLSCHPHYSKVIVFNRLSQNYHVPKVTEYLFKGDDLDEIANLVKGEELYCCLGTTIKKAKNREAFRKVDLDMPVKLAEIASKNKIGKFMVISSLGADAKSHNFYLQTKGLMEQGVLFHHPDNVIIVRPSMLTGKRKEFRLGERIGKAIMPFLGILLIGRLKRYKSIPSEKVAKAMLYLANNPQTKTTFESDELHKIAKLL